MCAQTASGAVGFRSKTCGIADASSLSLAKPAGTATGDVLVATFASENGGITPPAGWTAVAGLSGSVTQGQVETTWYRVATGAEPANYSFSGGSANAMAGNITAFTGVSTTSPVNAGAAQTIIGSIQTSATLPNANGLYPGSMRYSAVMSDDFATSTVFDTPMVSLCSVGTAQSSDIGFGAAYEPTGAGTTATRDVTIDDNGHMVLQTLVLNPACAGGSLALATPSSVTFPTVTLNGLNQSVPAVTAVDVTDNTGSQSGWNISATSTTFTSGPKTLPTTATQVVGGSATANAGTCVAPTNAISYPVTLPAATVAPTAVKIFNAATGTGSGTHDIDIAHTLTLPASTATGAYNSTWTWTIATGP